VGICGDALDPESGFHVELGVRSPKPQPAVRDLSQTSPARIDGLEHLQEHGEGALIPLRPHGASVLDIHGRLAGLVLDH
jgi:hypothetical protein